MNPTMKLRWVSRKVKNLPPTFNSLSPNANETVLQQLWEGREFGTSDHLHYVSEWRDIPIEAEK